MDLNKAKILLNEYAWDKSSARIFSKLELVIYLLITYYFSIETALLGFLVIETLNFITWYKKIRTGELKELQNKLKNEGYI